jgi:hypothetical protein
MLCPRKLRLGEVINAQHTAVVGSKIYLPSSWFKTFPKSVLTLPHFMEHESSLPWLQKTAIGPDLEPGESSLHSHTLGLSCLEGTFMWGNDEEGG